MPVTNVFMFAARFGPGQQRGIALHEVADG